MEYTSHSPFAGNHLSSILILKKCTESSNFTRNERRRPNFLSSSSSTAFDICLASHTKQIETHGNNCPLSTTEGGGNQPFSFSPTENISGNIITINIYDKDHHHQQHRLYHHHHHHHQFELQWKQATVLVSPNSLVPQSAFTQQSVKCST